MTWSRLAAFQAIACLLPLAFLSAACSSKEDSLPDGYVAIPPTAPMTPAERMAAIDAVVAELNDTMPASGTPWQERDLAGEVLAAADALVELPEVVAVMTSPAERTANIVLADAFPLLLINNRPPRGGTALAPGNREVSRPLVDKPVPSVAGSKKAVSVSFDGGQEIADAIKGRLSAEGYDIEPLTMSLDDMRNYKDLGFLHFDTHGGSAQHIKDLSFNDKGEVNGWTLGDDGNYLYSILSSTNVGIQNLALIEDELERGEVIVGLVEGNDGWRAVIGISELFIAKHWSFDDGVVIMHTCYGASEPYVAGGCVGNCPPGTPTHNPERSRQAIVGAGANVLMSFDNMTWATVASPSIYYFIDRLLGANFESPPEPGGRPFDWKKVETAMSDRGLMAFYNSPEYLNNVLLEGGDDAAPLAPSIWRIDIGDDIDVALSPMSVYGHFGAESDQVSLNGLALDVTSWEPNKIVAQVPHGTSRTGDVVVRTVNDFESNSVPLTQWTGEIVFTTITDDELFRFANIEARFRGDVHAFRDAVDATPKKRVTTSSISTPYVTGASSATGTSDDGGGNVTVYDGGDDLLVYGQAEIDGLLAGNRPTPIYSGTSEFAGLVELDPAKGQARLCLWIVGYHDVFLNDEQQPFVDGYFSLEPASFITDSSKGLLDCVHATLEDDFSIPDGKRTYSVDGSFVELEWKNFTATSVPTAATEG